MNYKQLNYFKGILECKLKMLLIDSGHTVSEGGNLNSGDPGRSDQARFYSDQILKLRIKSKRTELEKMAD